MESEIKTIIFDMDGTLADTASFYVSAFEAVLQDMVPNPPSREEFLRFFGTPTPRILEQICPPELLGSLLDAWPAYIRRFSPQVRLFPGVRSTLAALHAAGYHMAVVTSQIAVECEVISAAAGLGEFIETTVHSEMVARPKPNPDPVLLALEKLGAAPSSALMVGDSFNDLEAGQSAGTRIAAALWGASSPQRLLAYKPHFIFQRVEDLRVLLN